MITLPTLAELISAEPFRPFRLHMASGRVFDVRHPEMIGIMRSAVTVYSHPEAGPLEDRWEKISLMLLESVEPLPAKSEAASNGS